MNIRVVALALVGSALSCSSSGPAGERGPVGPTGPQGSVGPQGAPGPMGADGATGPAGVPGPQGVPGPAGTSGAVVILAVADGGAVLVDAGLIVVSGPAGGLGPAGPVGPPGATGVAGATGPAGAAGQSGGVVMRGADGGVWGVLAGAVFYDSEAHCGVPIDADPPIVGLCFTNPNCTGTPFVQGLSYPPVQGVRWPSLVGLCFYGNAPQNSAGFFRVREPVRAQSVQLFSCYRHNQSVCDVQSQPITSAFAIDGLPARPPFPRDEGFTLSFPE